MQLVAIIFAFGIGVMIGNYRVHRINWDVRQQLISEGWMKVRANPGQEIECHVGDWKNSPGIRFRK